ncbi:MAG: hypothetical protein JNM94_15225 [Phycisphaerae bacterium]|nr:hypothetical protein [Phycisphaerae bacterium]
MTSIESRTSAPDVAVATDARPGERRLFVALLAALACGLALVWTLRAVDPASVSGLTVTDVATHRAWVETPWSDLGPYRPSFMRASGVFLIYRFVAGADAVGYHIVNAVLLVAGTWCAMAVFRDGTRLQRGLAGASVACNPFLWLVSSGPNWEIPLVAAVSLAVATPLRRSTLPLHLALIVAAGLLKDGAGPILLAWTALRAATPRFGWLPFLVATLAIVTLAASWGVLELVWSGTSRITGSLVALLRDSPGSAMAEWSERGVKEPFIGLVMWGARWAANAISAPIRSPLVAADGAPFATGIGLAMNGVFTALATIGASLALVADIRQRRLPGPETVLVLFWATCIAAGVLFVQPRYLIPIVPIGCGLAAATRPRLLWSAVLVVAGCAALWVACRGLGMPHPRAMVATAPVHSAREVAVIE